MTAAENKNNRNCKSLVFGARWLVIKKNLARDKKVIDCAGSRETKHGKALSWPSFAATAKKTGKRTMITRATRDCTYWNFILCFICHLGFALWSTVMEHNSLLRRKSLISLLSFGSGLFASNTNIVWSEHLNIVHNQKNSPEHKSENGFLVNPPKIVAESHRPS